MNDMRIGGLASGMDIDGIVEKLMKAERMPLDKLTQKRQTLEWQRDDYRGMNKLLNDFDLSIFDGIYKQSTFTQKTISSSNESAVQVKNINSTSNTNVSIRVDQLAETAYMNSSADINASSTTPLDPTKLLKDERSKLATDFTSNQITIEAIQSDGTLGSPVTIDIDPNTDSLNSIITKINNSDAGVNAFYDEQTGKFSIMAKNTGDVVTSGTNDPEIKLTGDFFTSLNLAADNIAAGANGKEGKNALFAINGINTERSSNTFRINGFEYTLKGVTDSNNDRITQTGEEVTISSKTDTDKIFDSIVDFVDKYNELISKVNDKISEERYRDYKPLTDAQKKEMKDKEIELWEEKAKSGLLRNDSLLSNGLNKMRVDNYTPVSGMANPNYDSLTKIGITTSIDYTEKGKLVIDENKLKEAITNDPNAVYELFNKEVKDSSNNLVSEESGIALRLRQTIKDTVSNIELKAGNVYKTDVQYSLGRQLKNLNGDIDHFEDHLKQVEDRYWKQFSAMEEAIQRFNTQSTYLMQQFGQGQ